MKSDRRLSVTVLGINYAPEPTGIAPYTTRMAEGLRRRGHAVQVVTAFPHYPAWRVSSDNRVWTAREELNGIPLTRVRHYVPRRPTAGARVISELSFGLRTVLSDWSSPDVVVCLSPALLSTAIASLRAGMGHSRPALGVIVQDLYSIGLRETGGKGRRAATGLSELESWVLRRADGVAVIHERFRLQVVETLRVPDSRVDVIRNWTHLPIFGAFDRESFRERFGWGHECVVLHAGAMGDKQGLSNVVAAGRLAEATGAPIRFVLIGNGKQRARLEAEAAGCGAVEIRDPLSDDDFARALRAADVLLVNEKPGIVEMAVPSKLTSYFSAGVAVLAATEPGSTTSQEVAASGAGLRVNPGDPTALVAAAVQLGSDPELRTEMGSRGAVYCERLLSEEHALDAYNEWVWRLDLHRRGGSA